MQRVATIRGSNMRGVATIRGSNMQGVATTRDGNMQGVVATTWSELLPTKKEKKKIVSAPFVGEEQEER